MTDLVSPARIESIVGVARHPTEHWGRAVSAEQTVYILHSRACLHAGNDLRDCEYSVALDLGIDVRDWQGQEDASVLLVIADDGVLVPGTSKA
jgi:hypothetical protein